MRATTSAAGRRFVALLAVAALAATACGDTGADTRPTGPPSSSTTRPVEPAPPDQNLRDVGKAMIYSDGIAQVLPETAAQMICGALSPAEWAGIFGGTVGRTVNGGLDATCVVATGALSVELAMIDGSLGAEGERIHGRRVKVDDTAASRRVGVASAAVVPAGEQDPRANNGPTPNPCSTCWRG